MNTYDGGTHLFFASHYARGWFDPWEERWFGGFFVYSYPPLAHQLIALIGYTQDVEWGYRVVQLAVLAGLPIALWLLTREGFGAGAAGWAALFGSGIAGVYLLLYTFGQLPTILAVVLMLAAGAFLLRYW
ncbi:MAG: hypothetical protein HYX82_05215, partial [Chloroflexi bacterium]|nr:hypothetical protein [Chloroflexota bacterium]